jgi:AcrR family transcriptional regulator
MASENPRPRPRGRRPGPPAHDEAAGDALRNYVIDAVTEKVTTGLRATLDAKAADTGALDRLAPVARDVLDLWTREPPGTRRARFTRDEIARAALEIADHEGFEALSMRRLALALDAGTMTLYHYVRTKDELLALVSNAVMGELILDEGELSGGWRVAISNVARRSLATFQRHPWIFDVRDDPAIGPNGVRHFDQSLQALAELEIPLRAKLDILSAVDEYVFGYAFEMRTNSESVEDDIEMAEYVVELAATGEYPQIGRLIAEHGEHGAWQIVADTLRDPARFERTLRRLLDGIEGDLAPH